MVTFLSIVHIFVAIILIVVVLLQDSKGAGMGGSFGGGGNANTVLGATGAANLLVKVTRGAVVIFAMTAILLTREYTASSSSALDKVGMTPSEKDAPVQMANPPAAASAGTSAAGTSAQAPAASPAAPATPAAAAAPTPTPAPKK